MSTSMRFNFEPETMRNPNGSIKISDRMYRKRMGRRMLMTGLMFIGLVAGLATQGEGGFFHDIAEAQSIPLTVVGVLFLLFTILTTYMGIKQLGSKLVLTLNEKTTEVQFEQTNFGRSVVSETVKLEDLEPEVRESIDEIVRVLRATEPDPLTPPESEPLFTGDVLLQVKVLEGGSIKRLGFLTPEKDFVTIHTQIHSEAIVLNGSYESNKLKGIGVFIPIIPPREVRHMHDLRAMMDSGLMIDWSITRKGFEVMFYPSTSILTDFPKAKEVIMTLQPSPDDAEAMEIALADFKEAGSERKESFEHALLALGRRPIMNDTTDASA